MELFRNKLVKGELRNKPCICGSGKKMKKCHGANYVLNKEEVADIEQVIFDYKQKTKDLVELLKQAENN
jgi:hypothetical protein